MLTQILVFILKFGFFGQDYEYIFTKYGQPFNVVSIYKSSICNNIGNIIIIFVRGLFGAFYLCVLVYDGLSIVRLFFVLPYENWWNDDDNSWITNCSMFNAFTYWVLWLMVSPIVVILIIFVLFSIIIHLVEICEFYVVNEDKKYDNIF